PRHRSARRDRGGRGHGAAPPGGGPPPGRPQPPPPGAGPLRRRRRGTPRRPPEPPAPRGPPADFRHAGGPLAPGEVALPRPYTREEIRAAVEEAHRAGTYAAAHAHGGAGLRLAVEEGVGTIEHGLLADDEDVALMLERRVWLICTFSIFMHPTGIEQGDGQRP